MENRVLNDKNISVGRLIVTLLMLMIVVVGGTFAWLTYSSKESALVLTIGNINDTQIKLSPYQVTGNIAPGSTHTSGVYSEVEVTKGNNNSTSFALFYKINDIDTTLIDKGLSYTIVNTKGTSSTGDDVTVKTGKFSSLIDTSKPLPDEVIILDTNTDATLSANTSTYYRVYLWVDSSVGNQNDIQNSTLDVELNGSIGSVKINGYSVYGHTLTTDITDAVVDTSTTYSYQWYSSTSSTTKGGTAISGATSSSYTVGSGLKGKYIYVVVTTSKGKTLSDVTDANNNYTIEQECDNYNDGRVERTTPVLTLNPTSGTVEAGSDNTFNTTVTRSGNYVGSNYTGTQTAVSANTGNVTMVSGTNTSMTIGTSSSGSSTIKYHGFESVEAQTNITVTFTPSDTNNVCTVAKTYSVDKQDNTVPTFPTDAITTTANLNSATQTATLKCNDIVGVTGYYWGTTKPTASSTFKSITSTKSMSVTETVSASGTYYLACKDAAGNTTVATEKKQVYYDYTIDQRLLNVTGTQGTYTTANYSSFKKIPSSGKYVVPANTTMTRATIRGDAPTGASTSTYVGMSSSTASTTAATILSSDPKITANTSYVSWWNRLTYTITVTTGGNGSNKVQNERSQSVTATSSSANQSLTVRYGEKVTATATANTGYTFSGWSGGFVSGTTNPVTSAAVTANKTITASFTANTYTVTYYNGSTKISTSTHTYDNAKNLTTWANLGATVSNSSNGWSFAGWSTANNNTTRTYNDGQSVINLVATAGGNINLYAVYTRTVTFKSGVSAGTTNDTKTQYWNPAGTTNGTHLTSVASPAVTAITNWTALGFRNDTTAGDKEYAASSTIYPAYNGSNTLYGVYNRTLTFKSGVSAGTSDGTRTQYLNASSNTVSSVKSYEPAAITNWTALGYRDDTTAGDKEFSKGTSIDISPAYNTANTLYAVYSRTLTFKSGVNKATTDGTRTQYLNASSNTVSNIKSYGPVTITNWTALGYRDDTSSGDKEYASGTSTDIKPAYNVSNTLYAVYSRSYTATFNSGLSNATKKTVTSSIVYYNSNTTSTPTTTTIVTETPVDVSGWTKLGWRDDTTADAKEYNSAATVTVSWGTNFYAVYSRTITGYSGTSKATTHTSTQYYNSNGTVSTLTLPTATSAGSFNAQITAISGWTFAGWRDDTTAGASEMSTYAPAVGTTPATLHAVYSRTITGYSGTSKATTHTATQYYNSNGSVSTLTLPTASAAGSFNAKITAVSNWTFVGWRDDTTASSSEMTTYAPAMGTTPATLYAVYSRTLTVSYNGNTNTGGSTSNTTKTIYLSSNSTTTSSQEITLAVNGFTKTGYSFSKWAAGSTSGTQYAASAKYTPGVAYNASTFGTTMYAIWTANTYTVTLNNQGATIAGSASVTATYDSAMPSITVPAKTGWTFKGYYSSTSAVNAVASISVWDGTARINFNGTANGWLMTSADAGKHVQAVFTVKDTSLSNAPSLDFNDRSLTKGVNYTVSGGSGTWTYKVDIDVTTDMVTAIGSTTYDTTYRFIDVQGTSTSANVTVDFVTVNGKKYYSNTGTSAWNYDVAGNTTLYAKWTPNTYTIAYSYNGGTGGSKAPTSATFGTALEISNPTKTGYTFTGWSFNGNTSTAKYGANSSTVSTAWSSTSTKVTNTWFKDLTATNGATVTMTANWEKTVTGTFYYYDGSKISTKTSSCTMYNAATTCTITLPSEVSSSSGGYGGTYVGVSGSTSSMSTTTNFTISDNKSYYAVYRKNVTEYYSTTSTQVNSRTLYRNEFFTSTSAMNSILSTSNTGTSNYSPATGYYSTTWVGYNTSTGSMAATYASVDAAAKSTSTTLYSIYRKNVTEYYSTTSTQVNSRTLYRNMWFTSTSAMSTVLSTSSTGTSNYTPATGYYNTTWVGYNTSTGSMATTYSTVAAAATTTSTTLYSIYRSNVTVYRPTNTQGSGSATEETWYRNMWFSSTSAMSTVLSTSSTGTSNSSVTQVDGFSFAGFATGWILFSFEDSDIKYTTVAAAATSSDVTLHAVSSRTVTATFYYYNSGIKSSTASATQYLACGTKFQSSLFNNDITAPVTITSGTAQYGSDGIGWAKSTSTMSTVTPTTEYTAYYGVYRDSATEYYTSSSDSTITTNNDTLYRNAYFTSTSAMGTVLSGTQTGTSNYSPRTTGFGGTTWIGYTTSTNTMSVTYSTVEAAASSTASTLYSLYRGNVTEYYSTTSTQVNSRTIYRNIFFNSEGSYSVVLNTSNTGTTNYTPVAGYYNTTWIGYFNSTGKMTSVSVSGAASRNWTTVYSVYRTNVTVYHSTSSSVTQTMTVYRNMWFSSTSAMSTVLSTTKTGTSNYSTAEGYGGADWYGLTTSSTSTSRTYSSVSAAAQSNNATLYTIYQMSVTYSKGANVSAIGSTSGTCTQLASGNSCNVTLPSITANTGYTSVGWSTTNGATTGTAAGASYALTSDDQTLYANATDKTAPTISYTAQYADGSGNYTSGTWANKQVNTIISAVDTGSGVSYIQYILKDTYDSNSSASWSTFNFSVSSLTKNGTTWSGTEPWGLQTRNQYYYFRACDVSGNCTAKANFANWNIRYDLTAPSSVSYTAFFADNSGNYTSGSWTNKQVYTTITGKDDHVGVISKIQYTSNANATAEGSDHTTQWKTLNLAISGGIKSNSDGSYYGTESWAMNNNRNETFYFRVCDSLNNCSAKTEAYNIRYDTQAPSSTLTTTSTLNATSQTATLKCSDNVGVTGYYWGTSSTGGTYTTTSSDLTKLTGSSGLTKSISSAGTYYLFCKDSAGNVSTSTSKTYYSYSVQNLLETVAGQTGTYTSSNYATSGSKGTYIVPSGTSLTLNSIYSIPTGATSSTFKGYSTTYTTSVAELKTTAPSVSNGTTYYMWFNRSTYSLVLTKGTGISSVSGAGTYKYGQSAAINASAGTGYTFSKWTVGSGNTPASTATASTTITITQATNLTASATANTYKIAYSLNGGTAGTYGPTSATFDAAVRISNPTKSGYTFLGWTFNGNTSTAKYGSSSTSVTTSWSNTATKTKSEYFMNLTPTSGSTVTMTARWEKAVTGTFYYYDGSKISTKTSSCTMYDASTTCTITVPSEVSSSKGVYNTAYRGVYTSTGSMSTTSNFTISNNTTYYANYSSSVTVYRPSSTTAATSQTFYRNEWFANSSTMSVVLGSSNTATSNGSVTQVSGYSFYGLATATNTTTRNYSSLSAAAKTSTGTFYSISSKSVSATFYYNNNTTSGSCTVSSTTASATQSLYTTSTTAATIKNNNISVPSAVSGSVGKYNSSYKSVSSATSSMASTTPTTATANGTYYANYSSAVTIHYPSSTSAVASRTLYRNEWLTSTSACGEPVLSSVSGTSNATITSSVSGYSYYGFSASINTSERDYLNLSEAAKSSTNELYMLLFRSVDVTFYYNSNATSGSCTVSSATSTGTQFLFCKSTTEAELKNYDISVPSTVANSVGKYNSAYKGVSSATSSMTSTTPTTATANGTYYANYSSPVTVYRPSSTSAATTQTLYRNEWLTSTSACGNPVLGNSNTATSNGSITQVDGWEWYRLGTATNVVSGEYASLSAAAQTSITTFYSLSLQELTATFYYNSNTTSGSCTVSSATSSTFKILYTKSTTTAGIRQTNFSVPDVVKNSIGKYNSAYKGVYHEASSMSSNSPTTANTTFYANYSSPVTVYYSTSSAVSQNSTKYRNEWLTSTSACGDPVLANTNVLTDNYSTAEGYGGADWFGFATSASGTARTYLSISAAAKSTATTLYTLYTMSASYTKGANVSSIGSTSGSCVQLASAQSCQVTLPTITPNTGYTSIGWHTSTGLSVNSPYTITTDDVTLEARAADKTAPTGSFSITDGINTLTSSGGTLYGTSVIANFADVVENGSGINDYEFSLTNLTTNFKYDMVYNTNPNYTFMNLTSGEYKLNAYIYDNAFNRSTYTITFTLVSNVVLPISPTLDTGMIPVKIEDDGTVKTVLSNDSGWYDYYSKQWANVILVSDSSRNTYKGTSGVTVNESDILAYYVWIPRYKYKIWTTSTSASGSEQTIEIVFESQDAEMSLGTEVNEWRTHPAFWWDDDSDGTVDDGETLSGIWVGKFKTTGSSSKPTILPNKNVIQNSNIGTHFITSQKFGVSGNIYGLSNTDSHMLKNSEWGAVVYLSHSIYGINSEIYINNSISTYSGRSGGNVGGSVNSLATQFSDSSLSTSENYNTYGYYTWLGEAIGPDGTVGDAADRSLGTNASTTGNVTGVYDMAGEQQEYTMGYYIGANSNYASDPDTYFGYTSSTNYANFSEKPDSKYWDEYTTTSTLTACNGGPCFGHALSETSGWYGDEAQALHKTGPWVTRGSSYLEFDASAGAFLFSRAVGQGLSWRSVLVVGFGA